MDGIVNQHINNYFIIKIGSSLVKIKNLLNLILQNCVPAPLFPLLVTSLCFCPPQPMAI